MERTKFQLGIAMSVGLIVVALESTAKATTVFPAAHALTNICATTASKVPAPGVHGVEPTHTKPSDVAQIEVDIEDALEDAGEIDVEIGDTVHKVVFKTSDEKPRKHDLPPEVMEKLNAEQLASVLKHQATMRRDQAKNSETPDVALFVPIVMFLCMAFVIAFFAFFRYRTISQKQETLRAMVQQGVQIPQELLEEAPVRLSDLRRGLLWLGFGLGLLISLFISFNTAVWSMALVPVFFGVGHLIVWRLEPSPPPVQEGKTDYSIE